MRSKVWARRNKIPNSTPSSNQFSSRLIVSKPIFPLVDWSAPGRAPAWNGPYRDREELQLAWTLIKCRQSLDPANVTKTSFMSVLPSAEMFLDIHNHGRHAPPRVSSGCTNRPLVVEAGSRRNFGLGRLGPGNRHPDARACRARHRPHGQR